VNSVLVFKLKLVYVVASTYYNPCYVYLNNFVRELSAPKASTSFFKHFMHHNDPVYANPANTHVTVQYMPDSNYYYHVLRDRDCEHFDVMSYCKLQLYALQRPDIYCHQFDELQFNAMFHPAPNYSN
jgi:hypothetical protein